MNFGSVLWARCRRVLASCLVVGPTLVGIAQTNVVLLDVLGLTGQADFQKAYPFELTGWGGAFAANSAPNTPGSVNFGQVISSPDLPTIGAEIKIYDGSQLGAAADSFTILTNTIRITANTVGVACGEKHTLLLKRDGTVQALGSFQSGQIDVPVGLSGVVAVAAGTDHNLALTAEGKVVAWGWNKYHQLSVPSDLSHVVAIAAGRDYSLALLSDGSVRAWGGTAEGSGFDSDRGGYMEPPSELRRPGRIPILAIAAGVLHAVALRADGSVVGWGRDVIAWNPPRGSGPFTAISAGSGFSVGLRSDGTVLAWGDNKRHQLEVPEGLDHVVGLACGSYHTLALKADGTVVAWGDNLAGQTNIPEGISNVAAIAAGGFHSEILEHDGPLLSEARVSHGQFSCELGLPAGRRYRLQASMDLEHWSTVAIGTAYPTQMTWKGPARVDGAAFYRVKPIWPGEPGYFASYRK